MRTLILTSPHMKGRDVIELQHGLALHNWYMYKIDGEYGILTAQAVYRAKYWLGYTKPDQIAGDVLLAYLSGNKRRNPLMLLNTKNRLRKKPKPGFTLGAKALREAYKYLGTKESPAGSNKCFASVWYGLIGSWCAMAVSFWYSKIGSKIFQKGRFYAYVPYLVADARAGKNNLTITHNPMPGDIVTYDWPGESPGLADHTGLFEK